MQLFKQRSVFGHPPITFEEEPSLISLVLFPTLLLCRNCNDNHGSGCIFARVSPAMGSGSLYEAVANHQCPYLSAIKHSFHYSPNTGRMISFARQADNFIPRVNIPDPAIITPISMLRLRCRRVTGASLPPG